jgi:nucleoside-diphosphate-sugar epimerase
LVVVCGAGGFIGGHLVGELLHRGARVRAVDLKPPGRWFQRFAAAENLELDLQLRENCERALRGASQVYNLAADMGGIEFIETHRARGMLNVLINTHLLLAARTHGVERFFFASSACVYNTGLQRDEHGIALREDDAYPALPEAGYGWEKLFAEQMCEQFRRDFHLASRVARYHNVYGPHGSFQDGREKAPAAICRKVIAAKLAGHGSIEIWGSGRQTRSFMYIDDCIHGTLGIMESGHADPVNLGSSELVTIDELCDVAEDIAGVRLERHYRLTAPCGVAGRNSDNTRLRGLLNWEPSTRLRVGLERTYRWIYDQMVAHRPARSALANTAVVGSS